MTKGRRGYKRCSKCNAENGVRCHECKSCGATFSSPKLKTPVKKQKNKWAKPKKNGNKDDVFKPGEFDLVSTAALKKNRNGIGKCWITDNKKYSIFWTDNLQGVTLEKKEQYKLSIKSKIGKGWDLIGLYGSLDDAVDGYYKNIKANEINYD